MADEHTVLRVLLDGVELISIAASSLPVEVLHDVAFRRPAPALTFVDRRGARRVYDLSSAYDEGARGFRMSVRVSAGFAVQVDGLLEDDKGIRLQPFLLPESSADPAALRGRGLFARGLHFAGTITPTTVSLLCICDECEQSFRLQPYHAGFSDLAYFYCSAAPHTLVADASAGNGGPLPACEKCGGEFRYLNPLRCPHCRAPFVDFEAHPDERPREYYLHCLYGDTLQRWASPIRL